MSTTRKLSLLLAACCAFILLGSDLPHTGAQHSWQIIPGVGVGAITRQVSEADLKRIYGRKNVRSAKVNVGEGILEPGTVIYPDDPMKTVEIIWKDAAKKRFPQRIQLTGEESLWRTRHGISLGTRLKELERINGKPFVLTGFGWDYGGTVISWSQGRLEREFEKNYRAVLLRLSDQTNHGASVEEERTVLGDHEFSSGDRVVQKINPKVYQIVVDFP